MFLAPGPAPGLVPGAVPVPGLVPGPDPGLGLSLRSVSTPGMVVRVALEALVIGGYGRDDDLLPRAAVCSACGHARQELDFHTFDHHRSRFSLVGGSPKRQTLRLGRHLGVPVVSLLKCPPRPFARGSYVFAFVSGCKQWNGTALEQGVISDSLLYLARQASMVTQQPSSLWMVCGIVMVWSCDWLLGNVLVWLVLYWLSATRCGALVEDQAVPKTAPDRFPFYRDLPGARRCSRCQLVGGMRMKLNVRLCRRIRDRKIRHPPLGIWFVGILFLTLMLAVVVTSMDWNPWVGVSVGEASLPGPSLIQGAGFPSKHLKCDRCLKFFSAPGNLKEHLARRYCYVADSDPYFVDTCPVRPGGAAAAGAASASSASATFAGNGSDSEDVGLCVDLLDDSDEDDDHGNLSPPPRDSVRPFTTQMRSVGGVVCAANVSSLNTQLETVMQLPGGVLALTEVRLTESSQMTMRSDLEERKWSVVFGKPQEEWKTQWGAKAGGVAILARPGVPLQTARCTSDVQRELWDTGRWVHATAAHGDGKTVVHLMCVYGHSGAAGNRVRMDRNEDLLRKVFVAAAELGNVPVLILGDINVPPEASFAVSAALKTGRWVDAAAAVAAASGSSPDATCFVRDTSIGSRIDVILCNSIAAASLLDFGVVLDSGLPVHLPVACSLNLHAFSQEVPQVSKPRAVPLGWVDPEPEAEQWQSDRCVAQVWQAFEEAWQRGLRTTDVECLWAAWSAAAEKYLITRATDAGEVMKESAHQGRGSVKIKKVKRAASSQEAAEGADTMRVRRLQKFARKVEQLVHDMTVAPERWGHDQRCLEQKIRMTALDLVPAAAQEYLKPGPQRVHSLRLLANAVREEVQQLHEQARRNRTTAWKHWLAEAWGSKSGEVFKWCKGEGEERTSMVQRPDGTLTANAEEIDKLLRDAWLPIFRMYGSSPPPDWDKFAERFGNFQPKGEALQAGSVTAHALRKTLSKMRSSGSCGMDGWRTAEIKALPNFFLDRLAELLNIVEDSGTWPQALAQGAVSLISKGEGAEPLKLRPISVMPIVYRLWAAHRVRQVLQWQESWLSSKLHGFRPAHGAQDVWWAMAVKLEHALLSGEELSGISLDYSKCFDRVPIEIVFKVAEQCGMDGGILRAMRAMYKQLRRRFVLNGGVGAPFHSTNGILQGCPLSIVFLNLLVHVWVAAVEHGAPNVDPAGYADDTGALTGDAAELQPVADITQCFATLTGQQLNVEKSKCFSTTSAGRNSLAQLERDGGKFAVVKSLRCLGAHLRADINEANEVLKTRAIQAIKAARRIAWTSLPFRVKIELTSALVVQPALYGVQVGGMTAKLLNELQSACMKAVWGLTRKLRAKELVLTLLMPGHRVDPKQAAAYQCLKMLREMVCRRPELHALLRSVWQECVSSNRQRACGPIGLIFEVVGVLGWTWSEFQQFERQDRAPLPLTGGSDGWWLHEVRDGLRLAQWRTVAARRQDCAGLEAPQGVDKKATLKHLKGCKPLQQGGLRSVLSGSLRTRESLYKAKLADSPLCCFCNLATETLQHLWWQCPAWQCRRFMPDLPSERERQQLPACTQNLGIFLEDPELVEYMQHVPTGGAISMVGCSLPGDIEEEVAMDGRTVVWTDGACRNNQDARLRRAGAGIFYVKGSQRNWSWALEGRDQTNQRAELLAVVAVLRNDVRPLEIRTDSQYVFNGASSWQDWRCRGWRGDHADLWTEFSVLMEARGTIDTAFTKVVGHAKAEQVRRGLVEQIDKDGNDGADALATLAADAHAAPSQLAKRAEQRVTQAAAVHRMMLGILTARRAAEGEMQTAMPLEQDDSEDDEDEAVVADALPLAADAAADDAVADALLLANGEGVHALAGAACKTPGEGDLALAGAACKTPGAATEVLPAAADVLERDPLAAAFALPAAADVCSQLLDPSLPVEADHG